MDEEINLLDYWLVLAKRRKLILVFALAAMIIVFIWGSMQPKLYRAEASLMIVDTGAGGLAQSFALSRFIGNDGDEAKLIPLLRSEVLANEVSQGLVLEQYFFGLFSKEKDEKNRQKMIVNALKKSVEPIKKEGLLYVSVSWPDPQQAAFLANRYVIMLGKFLNKRSININYHVVDSATVPEAAYSPRVKLNTLIAGAIGLFFGIFICFVLEFLENMHKSD